MTETQGGEAAVVETEGWWDVSLNFQSGPVEQDGWMHVLVRTRGSSRAHALKAAQVATDIVTKGRASLVRAEPGAYSERVEGSDAIAHRGYARFSFKDEPGEVIVRKSYDEGPPDVAGFGKEAA